MTIDFFNILKFKGFQVHIAQMQLNIIHRMDNCLEWQVSKKWEIFNHYYKNNAIYKSIFISEVSTTKRTPLGKFRRFISMPSEQ